MPYIHDGCSIFLSSFVKQLFTEVEPKLYNIIKLPVRDKFEEKAYVYDMYGGSKGTMQNKQIALQTRSKVKI